jgi:hypothetical protein
VRRILFFLAVVELMMLLTLSSYEPATAGALTGFVREMGKASSNHGISGARVWVGFANGQKTTAVITDTDGRFEIANLPISRCTLFAHAIKYKPYQKRNVQIESYITLPDIELWPENVTASKVKEAATHIVKTESAAPTRVRAASYDARFKDLREATNLAPSSRVILALELNKHDAAASKLSPEIQNYLSASPEAVSEAETAFSNAHELKQQVPDKYAFELPPQVIADIILWQIKDTPDPVKRKLFVTDFLYKWKNTDAAKEFVVIEKKQPVESPLHRSKGDTLY